LDLPPFEVLEMMASGSVRYASTALGPGACDGDTSGGRSKKEVDGLAEGDDREAPGERGHEKREDPVEGLSTDLPVGEYPAASSARVGRWVFVSVVNSSLRGRKAAAAGIWVHTELSAVFLSSTPVSIGKEWSPEPPTNQQLTSVDALPSTGLHGV
ncbi:MAG: hypothetical protein ACREBZ_05205, partial [Thermoplasmata archaeon]